MASASRLVGRGRGHREACTELERVHFQAVLEKIDLGLALDGAIGEFNVNRHFDNPLIL